MFLTNYIKIFKLLKFPKIIQFHQNQDQYLPTLFISSAVTASQNIASHQISVILFVVLVLDLMMSFSTVSGLWLCCFQPKIFKILYPSFENSTTCIAIVWTILIFSNLSFNRNRKYCENKAKIVENKLAIGRERLFGGRYTDWHNFVSLL